MKTIHQTDVQSNRWLGHYRILRMVLIYLSLLALPVSSMAGTLNGFVTQVISSTDFDVGALHVMMSGKTQCETEDLHSDIQLISKPSYSIFAHHYFVLHSRPVPASARLTSCQRLPLTVGSHIRILGDARQGSFLAKLVIAYNVEIRQTFATDATHSDWEGGALLEETPQVSRTEHGWAGTMWLDGYPMTVTPDTYLQAAPLGTEMGYRPFRFFDAPEMGAILSKSSSPAFSATLLRPNTWATYRGAGRVGGDVLLYQARLWTNQIDIKEKEYWTQLAPLVRTPEYWSHIPGSVRFAHMSADKVLAILPDQNIQDFVSKLGESLIPQYQKALPELDTTKIDFRFYVVRPNSAELNAEMTKISGTPLTLRPSANAGAVAVPNGLILVPDSTLVRVHDVAQLASILSYAITSVLQKHSYITRYARSSNMSGMDFSSFLWDMSKSEQSLRIGIRQMYLSGYDIRESPFAWAVAQGKPVNNPIINSKNPDKEIPWYAAYAFNYISQYYQDVDYSKLKRGQAEYQQFLKELYKADPSLPHPTNAPSTTAKK